MRGVLALLLILPPVAACIGPGYACDRGAVEIHAPVNIRAAEDVLTEANAVPVGQKWGVHGEIRVFYGQQYPVLLYIWPGGVRIQLAVKEYERNGMSERCEFYMDPGELNVKSIVRTELAFLRERGVLKISGEELEEAVRLAGWGLAGNRWLEVGRGGVRVEGVRGCRETPVFVLAEWRKGEEKRGVPAWAVVAAALLLLVWLAAGRR